MQPLVGQSLLGMVSSALVLDVHHGGCLVLRGPWEDPTGSLVEIGIAIAKPIAKSFVRSNLQKIVFFPEGRSHLHVP